MRDSELWKLIPLLIFALFPLVRWIFKKLYEVSQAQQVAMQRILEERQRSRAQERDRFDAEEEAREDRFEAMPLADESPVARDAEPAIRAELPVNLRTPRASRPMRPIPRSPVGQITQILQELTREAQRPEPKPPPVPVVSPPIAAPAIAVSPPLPRAAAAGPLGPPRPTPTGHARAGTRHGSWIAMPRDRSEFRRLIVWSELLAPPLALREKLPGEG